MFDTTLRVNLRFPYSFSHCPISSSLLSLIFSFYLFLYLSLPFHLFLFTSFFFAVFFAFFVHFFYFVSIQFNPERAVDCYLKAAALGCHDSHYRLAVMYKSGSIIPMDIPQGTCRTYVIAVYVLHGS